MLSFPYLRNWKLHVFQSFPIKIVNTVFSMPKSTYMICKTFDNSMIDLERIQIIIKYTHMIAHIIIKYTHKIAHIIIKYTHKIAHIFCRHPIWIQSSRFPCMCKLNQAYKLLPFKQTRIPRNFWYHN